MEEQNLEVMRGFEDAVAGACLDAFGDMLSDGWAFEGGVRRPPTDPVNALLSSSSTACSCGATATWWPPCRSSTFLTSRVHALPEGALLPPPGLASSLTVMEARITADPTVCGGKPCVRGTRIMVKNILGMFAGGYDAARILAAYPELTPADVSAALEYASRVLDEEKVVVVS